MFVKFRQRRSGNKTVTIPQRAGAVTFSRRFATDPASPVSEDRLLAAVKAELGYQVERLCYPPFVADAEGNWNPFTEANRVGIPVAPFPRWVRCPQCDLLAPLNFGVFELKVDKFRADRTRYVHANCNKAKGGAPMVLPVRFLVACEQGHLDDFPWIDYVHQGQVCGSPVLRLREWGVSGSVSEVQVSCDTCGAKRRMRDAFGEDGKNVLPKCLGRRPHLRDYADKDCTEFLRCILLGASNSWFPITLAALHVPTATKKLEQLVEHHWAKLEAITSLEVLAAFRKIGQLTAFAEFSDSDVWQAIQKKRGAADGITQSPASLKVAEWAAFSKPDPARNTDDFMLREVAPPKGYEQLIGQIVLVDRLREVRALTGFTRIDSPGNFSDIEDIPKDRRAPISRHAPLWVPASEVRGEGIFIQFDEQAVVAWCKKQPEWEAVFRHAHREWRRARQIENPDAGFAGIRYVMLHSLSHALMRQIALECGYTPASIRERIYSLNPQDEHGPMAGVLIYTGAADSEGTLGGLVSLGEPVTLGRLLDQALEQVRLCASDPLCGEHHPHRDGLTLHGAACHACLFSPETSCEHGNRYLDRTTLVQTFHQNRVPFFQQE
ncbi:MAG: DrmB family protein [Limisphaerales bacterium]